MDLQDIETPTTLKKINDDIKKEIKKQQKEKSTKPQDIFVGFKGPDIKTRKKGGLRFTRSGKTY